jgi:hypothetical protein
VKKFTATMNDGSFINVEATRMELVENMVRVYDKTDLVAMVDISAVITAHISERGGSNG